MTTEQHQFFPSSIANLETRAISVTPQMAREWLGSNLNNRNLNESKVNAFAKEMKQGIWHLTHQGIAFFEDGLVADGQHRLRAVVKSGCTIDMTVTTGLSKNTASVIDTHQQRRTHQSLKMAGFDWIGSSETATIKLMIAVHTGATTIQNQEVINFGLKHREKIIFSNSLTKTNKNGLRITPVLAAVAIAHSYEKEEELRAFHEVLLSGMPRSQKDKAAILLRDWLLSNKTFAHSDRMKAVKRVMRSIMAFCQKQELGKLIQPEDFLYKLKDADNNQTE